jgi:hypothetical protein
MQLRFASFVVINLRRDLHPQECAHAGRTIEKGTGVAGAFSFFSCLTDCYRVSWGLSP